MVQLLNTFISRFVPFVPAVTLVVSAMTLDATVPTSEPFDATFPRFEPFDGAVTLEATVCDCDCTTVTVRTEFTSFTVLSVGIDVAATSSVLKTASLTELVDSTVSMPELEVTVDVGFMPKM